MAALETRILVLGGVRLFEPLNGYQLRRELLSWGVEQWAQIRAGSIYSMLATLTKEGCLERHEVDDDGRSVTVYTMTGRGDDELRGLIRDGIAVPHFLQYVPFQAAFSLLPLVTRDDFLEALDARLRALHEGAADEVRQAREAADEGLMPPHVSRIYGLWHDVTAAEIAWIERLQSQVAAGDLRFAGDPQDWQPPDDDPGWQMHAERERYNALLGRTPRRPVPRPGDGLF